MASKMSHASMQYMYVVIYTLPSVYLYLMGF